MKRRIVWMMLGFIGMGFLTPMNALSAETITYRGTGTFVANRSTLPLANGGAAFQFADAVVATIEPSEHGVLYGDCAGLGYADADGIYTARAFCTFAETDVDGFAIDAKVEPGAGGTVKIIGGTGKWAGANGEGTLESKDTGDYGGSYKYEFRITTP